MRGGAPGEKEEAIRAMAWNTGERFLVSPRHIRCSWCNVLSSSVLSSPAHMQNSVSGY